MEVCNMTGEEKLAEIAVLAANRGITIDVEGFEACEGPGAVDCLLYWLRGDECRNPREQALED